MVVVVGITGVVAFELACCARACACRCEGGMEGVVRDPRATVAANMHVKWGCCAAEIASKINW